MGWPLCYVFGAIVSPTDTVEEAQGRALMARAAIDHLEAVRIVSGVPEGRVSYLREW